MMRRWHVAIAKERALRARRFVRGLTVSVTGFLGMGTRSEVTRFSQGMEQRYGTFPRQAPTF